MLKGSDLESQVDELLDTFNDIAKMLGKDVVVPRTAKADNLTFKVKREATKALNSNKVCSALWLFNVRIFD